ncbi:MAG: DNRLRE domain-containing protein [Patescibacteria group bacterium]|nr:DNRLRE domain-containing protein [Patescibacteria group bacterium]
MKDKKIISLISLIFFSTVLINITPTRAIIKDQTISTIAEKDTYVNTDEALSNFGGQDYALGGFYFGGDIVEAYFFFNFSDKPSTYTKAEISLDFWSVSQTMNVSIYLIEEEWDEYSMTWINKPSKGAEITSIIITQSDIYTINVTNFIAGRNNLSICVYIKVENYVNDYFYITTREGFYSWAPEDAPQLIWTYPGNVEITVTNPTSSSNWLELNIYTIQWTSTGDIDNVKIELYKGALFVEEITSVLGYTINDGTYDFYVSIAENYDGTDYRIKISDFDDPNVYGYSGYFSINVRSGTMTITSPTSSSSWQAGTIKSITWTSTGNLLNVDIEIYKGAVLMYYIYDVSNLGIKLWDIDAAIEIGTDWRIKISNSDNSAQYDWSDYFEIYNARDGGAISGYDFYIILMISIISLTIITRKIKK